MSLLPKELDCQKPMAEGSARIPPDDLTTPRGKTFPLRRVLVLLVQMGILFSALVLNAREAAALSETIPWGDRYLRQRPEWYATAEARRIADNLLQYQSPVGGWPKSVDLAATPTPESLADAMSGGRANSLDNDATTQPMEFLARIAQATGDERYRQSFARGLDYLFAAQYPNGGWPQYFPLRDGYYSHITYNDGAMIHALTLLRDVASGRPPYDFVDARRRAKAADAVARGIDCILRTQIRQDGKLTAWCAQHDEKTLAPAWARNYEIPSLSGAESVGIVRFLMGIEQPTPEIIDAIEGAVAWLRSVTITGLRYQRGMQADGKNDGWVEPDPTAGPLWSRFYELGSNRPIFTGRDRIVRYSLSEIERERRGGYAFYGDWAKSLLARDYPRWTEKHDISPARKAASDAVPAGQATSKPRVIVTQDGEIDDQSSMVRFLMYSSDYDVIGIVENNSIFQKRGHSREQWVQKQIDLYAQVYPNLKKHNADFPTPDYLKSVIRLGNENPSDLQVGPDWTPVEPANMATQDTPGSELIIRTLLDDDPRPVHVPSWGGANTTAYALWKIKTTLPDQWERASSRIRIHAICYNLTNKAQDGGIPWIIRNLPEVKIYQSAAWSRTWNYSSVGKGSYSPPEVQAFMTGEWLTNNVKNGHGPLGECYPQKYVSEGDTPSFLPLINNGLNQHLDYTLGGWGGRAKCQSGNHMVDANDDAAAHPEHKAFWRWIPAAQNDFAARMDWCVAMNFAGANHNPRAKTSGPLLRTVSPGETVTLDASSSTDPDGNMLAFKWWQYHEADSAEARVAISDATGKQAGFVVPNEPGKQLQIILEVTDNGTPPLTGYARVLCNIK